MQTRQQLYLAEFERAVTRRPWFANPVNATRVMHEVGRDVSRATLMQSLDRWLPVRPNFDADDRKTIVTLFDMMVRDPEAPEQILDSFDHAQELSAAVQRGKMTVTDAATAVLRGIQYNSYNVWKDSSPLFTRVPSLLERGTRQLAEGVDHLTQDGITVIFAEVKQHTPQTVPPRSFRQAIDLAREVIETLKGSRPH